MSPDADDVLTTTRAVRRRLDPTRPVLLDLIRECVDVALQAPAGSNLPRTQERTTRSADALATTFHEVDTIVIACLEGVRLGGVSAMASASLLGGVFPATWSFMLAARARGLGTCWTTMHLAREREAADLLRIPFDRVQQVCLTPVAFTAGERFCRARRPAVDDVLHLDGWDADLPSAPDVRGLAAR